MYVPRSLYIKQHNHQRVSPWLYNSVYPLAVSQTVAVPKAGVGHEKGDFSLVAITMALLSTTPLSPSKPACCKAQGVTLKSKVQGNEGESTPAVAQHKCDSLFTLSLTTTYNGYRGRELNTGTIS